MKCICHLLIPQVERKLSLSVFYRVYSLRSEQALDAMRIVSKLSISHLTQEKCISLSVDCMTLIVNTNVLGFLFCIDVFVINHVLIST